MTMSNKRKERNKQNLGQKLRSGREKAGFTQKALADALGIEYYTMVSQMELGYISIPATLWVPIAETLGMNRSEWVIDCVNEYSPDIFKALFDHRSKAEVCRIIAAMRKGALDEQMKGD